MRYPYANPIDRLFAEMGINMLEDEGVFSREDLEDKTKELNEILIKELREAGY